MLVCLLLKLLICEVFESCVVEKYYLFNVSQQYLWPGNIFPKLLIYRLFLKTELRNSLIGSSHENKNHKLISAQKGTSLQSKLLMVTESAAFVVNVSEILWI